MALLYFAMPLLGLAQNGKDRKEGVSDEYSQNDKIASELQVKAAEITQFIECSTNKCEKLFDDRKSNNFLYSCYYCDYETNNKNEYESHIVLKHLGKLSYPGKKYLEKLGLQLKGKNWEMYGS